MRAKIAAVAMVALLAQAAMAEVFSDDFSTFDSSKWTQYGGDNISVNGVAPGMVWVDGANNFEPAARITHQMSTGTGNFRMQFDLKHTGDTGTGQGCFKIGWCVENDFALIQNHQTYQYNEWWGYGSHVGLEIFTSPPPTKTLMLEGSNNGQGYVNMNVAQMQAGQWYTVVGYREGGVMHAELWTQGMGSLLGSAQWQLPAIRDYQYFHFSTQESICNSAHSYFLVDNLQLTTSPVPLPAAVWPGLGLLVAVGLWRRRWAMVRW